jgi:branched-chain amino acid aminotransferase
MEGLAYLDGEIGDLADATVPLNDRGYLLGDGVFETLRTSNGHLFRLADHRARLRDGLKVIGLEADLIGEFDAAVQALSAAGQKRFGDELYLRVNITTGVMEDIAGTDHGASITAICKPFKPYPLQYYAKGVQVVLSDQRKDSCDPLCRVKTLSYIHSVTARRRAHSLTAHDALLRNEEGRITEATTSNVFARRGDTVYAPGPDEGALAGVTRAVVLELLEDVGLDVEEVLDVDTLRKADEAWLTNTTGGVIPLTRFDDTPIGDGGKGELTTRLGHAYEDLVRSGHDHDGA